MSKAITSFFPASKNLCKSHRLSFCVCLNRGKISCFLWGVFQQRKHKKIKVFVNHRHSVCLRYIFPLIFRPWLCPTCTYQMFLTAPVTLLLISSSLINKYSSCDVIILCYPFVTESVKIIPVGVTFHKGHKQAITRQDSFARVLFPLATEYYIDHWLTCTLIPSLSVHCFPKEMHV